MQNDYEVEDFPRCYFNISKINGSINFLDDLFIVPGFVYLLDKIRDKILKLKRGKMLL